MQSNLPSRECGDNSANEIKKVLRVPTKAKNFVLIN